MKIILEFTDDEARQAEQAYRGPQYASAIEDFREFLRSERKYGNHNEAEQEVVQKIESAFYETFQGLLND